MLDIIICWIDKLLKKWPDKRDIAQRHFELADNRAILNAIGYISSITLLKYTCYLC